MSTLASIVTVAIRRRALTASRPIPKYDTRYPHPMMTR
jgi:hypothetical protein